MSEETMTMDPPTRKSVKAKTGIAACVGLPIQYVNHDGTVVPGLLQRKARMEDGWDIVVFISGSSMPVNKPAVRQSEEHKPGCWTYLPGLGG